MLPVYLVVCDRCALTSLVILSGLTAWFDLLWFAGVLGVVGVLVSGVRTLCVWCCWSFRWFGLGYLVAIGLFFDLGLGFAV